MSEQSTWMKQPFAAVKAFFIASAAALTVSVATPASAHIEFGHLHFDDDEDVLQQLIDLDADDIDELREEFADARVEIREAISEIDEAREEVEGVPGGKTILKTALSAASAIVSKATSEAFEEVRAELADAESELAGMETELSAEEYAETQMAIDVIRTELVEIEVALDELLQAMRA